MQISGRTSLKDRDHTRSLVSQSPVPANYTLNYYLLWYNKTGGLQKCRISNVHNKFTTLGLELGLGIGIVLLFTFNYNIHCFLITILILITIKEFTFTCPQQKVNQNLLCAKDYLI